MHPDLSPHPPVEGRSLALRLARYAERFRLKSSHPVFIPTEALAEAKRRVLDSFGCAFGAMDSMPAKIARQIAGLSQPAQGLGSTLLGSITTTTPELAAFANGVLVRYLDFNDTYLSKEPAHPSDNIPAILAVAEAEGKSGMEVLRAIVLAYEIQCRLCDAASIRVRGWDHVTYGALSTSLATGMLMDLDAGQLSHALALAATPNVAMRQTRVGELSHWKGCAFANAARNGVFAAQLARAGMTGPYQIFEGEMGFCAQVSGSFTLDVLAGETGKQPFPFMINQTYIKHFPAEYHSQSAIEAALTLRETMRKETGLPLADLLAQIESIQIDSFDAAVDIIAGFVEHWAPKSRETADHSMPYCVAAALTDGSITLQSFSQQRIQDPALRALIQTVTVRRDPELSAGYPDGIPNRITVTLKSGQTFIEMVRYPLGHAKNPMQDRDVAEKFRTLASQHLSAKQIPPIINGCQGMDKLQVLNKLLQLLSYQ